MSEIELQKLRRFGLTTGLLLCTYLAAGIVIEPNTKFSAWGVSFTIARPDLLPFGLALASLCAALRFQYYGIWLATSPRQRRRDLLDGLMAHPDEYIRKKRVGIFAKGKQLPMYWGFRKFTTSPRITERDVVEKRVAAFDGAFPKFARARAVAVVMSEETTDDEGNEYWVHAADVTIPRRCRIAAVFEDFDYTAPVWLNVAALAWFTWNVAR